MSHSSPAAPGAKARPTPKRSPLRASRVVIADVRDTQGEETAAALSGRGLDVRYSHLDVTDERAWPEIIADIEAHEGGLDVLVNNAGIIRVAALSDLSMADWHLVQQVNATSVVLGIRAATPAMIRRGGGSIVNVASTAAPPLVALHEAAGEGGAGVGAYLSALQTPEDRIDIVRVDWDQQMADTARLLDAFEQARSIG